MRKGHLNVNGLDVIKGSHGSTTVSAMNSYISMWGRTHVKDAYAHLLVWTHLIDTVSISINNDIFHTNLFYSEIGFWYGLSKSSTYTDYRICCRNASGSCSSREIGFSATRGWSQSEGQVRKGWSYGLAGAERLMLIFSPFIPIVLALLVLVTRVCFDSCLWWLFVSVVCAIS